MTMYYVATLASYVLVSAENESEARERGLIALEELRPGATRLLEITTIRPATHDEIEMDAWFKKRMAGEY